MSTFVRGYMFVYVVVCVYVCCRVHVCLHVCLQGCLRVYLFLYQHVCMRVCVVFCRDYDTHTCLSVFVYMFVCLSVCVCVCVYAFVCVCSDDRRHWLHRCQVLPGLSSVAESRQVLPCRCVQHDRWFVTTLTTPRPSHLSSNHSCLTDYAHTICLSGTVV